MAQLKQAKISIAFKSTAAATIELSGRGIVGMIVKDVAGAKGVYELYNITDVSKIPVALNAVNLGFISDAFQGKPSKLILVVQDTAVATWTASLTELETRLFDYAVVPAAVTADKSALSAWITGLRNNKGNTGKMVIGSYAGDNEGVVNFATDNIKLAGKTVNADQFSARIAGALAGCALNTSVTNLLLPEVLDVPHLTDEEFDAAIGAGKLVLKAEPYGVVIARGVNSLQTTSTDKGDQFKKIHLVDIMDQIKRDVTNTIKMSYLGKVANSYDNKCLLISAINGYFKELENGGILEKGQNGAYLDINAQKAYLTSIGRNIDKMKLQEIKEANTGDKVFLAAKISPLDTMEEITLNISL